jgi:hypothetical protein
VREDEVFKESGCKLQITVMDVACKFLKLEYPSSFHYFGESTREIKKIIFPDNPSQMSMNISTYPMWDARRPHGGVAGQMCYHDRVGSPLPISNFKFYHCIAHLVRTVNFMVDPNGPLNVIASKTVESVKAKVGEMKKLSLQCAEIIERLGVPLRLEVRVASPFDHRTFNDQVNSQVLYGEFHHLRETNDLNDWIDPLEIFHGHFERGDLLIRVLPEEECLTNQDIVEGAHLVGGMIVKELTARNEKKIGKIFKGGMMEWLMAAVAKLMCFSGISGANLHKAVKRWKRGAGAVYDPYGEITEGYLHISRHPSGLPTEEGYKQLIRMHWTDREIFNLTNETLATIRGIDREEDRMEYVVEVCLESLRNTMREMTRLVVDASTSEAYGRRNVHFVEMQHTYNFCSAFMIRLKLLDHEQRRFVNDPLLDSVLQNTFIPMAYRGALKGHIGLKMLQCSTVKQLDLCIGALEGPQQQQNEAEEEVFTPQGDRVTMHYEEGRVVQILQEDGDLQYIAGTDEWFDRICSIILAKDSKFRWVRNVRNSKVYATVRTAADSPTTRQNVDTKWGLNNINSLKSNIINFKTFVREELGISMPNGPTNSLNIMNVVKDVYEAKFGSMFDDPRQVDMRIARENQFRGLQRRQCFWGPDGDMLLSDDRIPDDARQIISDRIDRGANRVATNVRTRNERGILIARSNVEATEVEERAGTNTRAPRGGEELRRNAHRRARDQLNSNQERGNNGGEGGVDQNADEGEEEDVGDVIGNEVEEATNEGEQVQRGDENDMSDKEDESSEEEEIEDVPAEPKKQRGRPKKNTNIVVRDHFDSKETKRKRGRPKVKQQEELDAQVSAAADMDDDSSKEAEFEDEAAIPKNKRGRKFKRRNLAKPIRVDAPKKTQRKQRRSKKKSS